MGRTALYADPVPFRSARAEVQLDADVLVLRMPDGRHRRHVLHGMTATTVDGAVSVRVDVRWERRFVRMLVLERDHERVVVITPPDRGAVAPNVVRVPDAPSEAAIVDDSAWEVLSEWVLCGGRLAACAMDDLARLAVIASPQFAALIGEVAAQRALELVWAERGPLRGASDLDDALQPLADAARVSVRAGEALFAALAHAAGVARLRRR
ncbi:MAG: hypothetical protein ACKV2T_08725 [Kofleriaceae bacterium]